MIFFKDNEISQCGLLIPNDEEVETMIDEFLKPKNSKLHCLTNSAAAYEPGFVEPCNCIMCFPSSGLGGTSEFNTVDC